MLGCAQQGHDPKLKLKNKAVHSSCMSGHNGTEEDVDGTGLTRMTPPMVRVEEDWIERQRKPP